MKKQTIWDKKIPNLLVLVLITIGISITSVLVQKSVIFGGHAAPTNMPQDVKISNSTDKSVTISYATSEQATGALSLGTTKSFGQTIFDDRDKTTPQPHTIHFFTVKNLTPQTTYYFSITSGDTTFSQQPEPYAFTTASVLTPLHPTNMTITGKVVLPNGESPPEALVYAQPTNGQLLSVLTDSQGRYHFHLDTIRDKTLSQYLDVSGKTIFAVSVIAGQLTSHVTYILEKTNTIPPITLSNNYDFRSVLETEQEASASGTSSFPVFSSGIKPSDAVPQILTPKKGEGLTDQQPLFQGIALPNQRVDIVIHSDLNLQTHITADANGRWTFRPATPLPPGNHTIAITSVDRLGVLKTIVQSFTVFAAGSQIFEVAPSVTPTPTPTLPPAPTITPTLLPPTPTPTTIVIPTPTSITPTATLTPTIPAIATPTVLPITTPLPTRGPPPKTGSNSLVVLGISGIFITVIGIALFILTTGGML